MDVKEMFFYHMSAAECCHAVHEENNASLCCVERRDVLDLVALQWQALVVRHDFWIFGYFATDKGVWRSWFWSWLW